MPGLMAYRTMTYRLYYFRVLCLCCNGKVIYHSNAWYIIKYWFVNSRCFELMTEVMEGREGGREDGKEGEREKWREGGEKRERERNILFRKIICIVVQASTN